MLVRRGPFQGGAWVFPAVALVWVGPMAGEARSAELWWVVTGMVAGALWQLTDRRDVADRLTLLASLLVWVTVIGIVVVAPGGDVDLLVPKSTLLVLAGTVTGLVFVEQFHRWRGWRRLKRRIELERALARQAASESVG